MNRRTKLQAIIVLLCAGIAANAFCDDNAESEIQASGDYFNIIQKVDRSVNNVTYSSGKLRGELWGGTIGFNVLQINEGWNLSLEGSFRRGMLTGSENNNGFLQTDKNNWNEGAVRAKAYSSFTNAFAQNVFITAGLDYQDWLFDFHLPAGGLFVATGTPNLTYHERNLLVTTSVGYSVALINKTFANNTALETGPRIEAMFATGYGNDADAFSVYNVGIVGTWYMKYRFRSVTFFGEGGYLLNYWSLFNNQTSSNDENYTFWGPYVRVGAGFTF